MEEGKIPDDAITASSSYETKSVGPQNARYVREPRTIVDDRNDSEIDSHKVRRIILVSHDFPITNHFSVILVLYFVPTIFDG